MLVKSVFVLLTICVLLMPVSESPQTTPYDLPIKGGRIIDGSGRAGYVADLAVKGDRIVAIGNLSNTTAERVSFLY